MPVRAQSSVARAECTAGSAATVIPWNVAAAKSVGSVVPIGELESVDLLAAQGRILAGNVTAILPSPPFDMSAMDGYAVRLDALDGPAPWRVPIAGRIAAGDPVAPTHGAVWQMLTGARVPEGFDAVVMQEHCVVDDGSIILSEQPTPGRNIRKTGEDVHLGDPLHRRGERITSRMLGLLASQGLFKVNVVRKVRIALVSTGSELVEPGAPRAAHQIFNSNRIMLRAALAACEWADVVDFGIIPDDRNTIASVLKEAAAACDAVLTTGGVSAGDADHVAGAMLDRGGSFELLKVAMRPGKPVKIGKLDGRLFLGLPGNPNAALVTFRMIAMPALRRLAGLNNVDPQWSRAVSDFRYEKPLGRTEFIPVRRLAGHGSHDLLQMLGRGSTPRPTASRSCLPISVASRKGHRCVMKPRWTEAEVAVCIVRRHQQIRCEARYRSTSVFHYSDCCAAKVAASPPQPKPPNQTNPLSMAFSSAAAKDRDRSVAAHGGPAGARMASAVKTVFPLRRCGRAVAICLFSLLHDHSAIDHDQLAGHVVGV